MITPIPALPAAPTRSEEKGVFNAKAEAWSAALGPWTTSVNLLASEVDGLASDAEASQIAAAASETAAAASEANAANSAASALNAPGTNGTSTTSLTVGTGTKVFTTQSGKAWSKGQTVVAASSATPTTQMIGVITDYTGTSLTISVSSFSGSGTLASWIISMAAGTGLAFASQAEAEAGTNADKVMSPLRTAQLIDVRARLTGSAATAAPVTLTAASPYLQTVTNTVPGRWVTLPDATTLVRGPRFAITNDGDYDLMVKDSTGVTVGYIRPGTTGTCLISDISTAAGVWRVGGGAAFGVTALGPVSGSVTLTRMDIERIDSARELILITNSNITYGVVYDASTGSFGALTTLASEGAAISGLATTSFGDGRVALCVSLASTTTASVKVRIITATGTSLAAGTATTFNSTAVSGPVVFAGAAVGATHTFFFLDPTDPSLCRAFAITASGSTITAGSVVTVYTFGAGTAQTETRNRSSWVGVFGSSIVWVRTSGPGDGGVKAVAMTVSGTTITVGSTAVILAASMGSNAPFYVLPYDATRAITFTVNGSQNVQARAFSVSGTTITLGTAATDAGTFVGAGDFNNGNFCVSRYTGTDQFLVVSTNSGNVYFTDFTFLPGTNAMSYSSRITKTHSGAASCGIVSARANQIGCWYTVSGFIAWVKLSLSGSLSVEKENHDCSISSGQFSTPDPSLGPSGRQYSQIRGRDGALKPFDATKTFALMLSDSIPALVPMDTPRTSSIFGSRLDNEGWCAYQGATGKVQIYRVEVVAEGVA